jgi:beta-lactamase regulating signal transducer with metallopeptidase domain
MMLQWLASPEWANVVKALLHTLWQGAAIVLLLGLALRHFSQPVARYRCSLAALLGLVLAGLVTWAVLNRPEPQRPAKVPVASAPVPVQPAVGDDPVVVVVSALPPEPRAVKFDWTAWLALIWLLGAAAMLARAGFQVAGAERLRRSSRPLNDASVAGLLAEARRAVGLARRVRLAVTERLTSPAVVGVFLPTLILPLSLTTTLSADQIRFILLHELAHIQRGDYFANLFQLFAEALLFFNPAAWWISRHIRLEREACCDALAIELSGAPADYAQTLVQVAERILLAPPAAAPALGNRREPSSLADRIQRLLVPGYRPHLRMTWRAMLAALLVGSVLLTLSAIGTRVTVAAILSPQQRIERIEKKMTEYGENPAAANLDFDAEHAPQVKIAGHIRMADGSPVPQWVWLNVYSAVPRSSYGLAMAAKDGTFSGSIRAGIIYIGAVVTNCAPAVIGPLDGTVTNRFDNLELVLNPGFDVPLQVADVDSGKALTNVSCSTTFWMENSGFASHSWQSEADGSILLTHCADLPLDVTVKVPGYEIVKKRFDHLHAGEPLRMELRRGETVSGTVIDQATSEPLAGAEFHLLYESGGEAAGHYEWDDALHRLGSSDAVGAFHLNQMRHGCVYYLGVSAPGHESVILKSISPGTMGLVVRLGPELVVRGHVTGHLEALPQVNGGPVLDFNTSEVFENNSYGNYQRVPLHVVNGVATFQFTNRVAGPVTVSVNGWSEERDITAPVEDWALNVQPAAAAETPKREVIFRFKSASGVLPGGTVSVTIPDNLEIKHRTAHMQEMQITNGEVRVPIAIGGETHLEPKRLVGYWFSQWTLGYVTVTNGAGPLILDVPLVPAGAIYARALNADGSPAGGLFFGVTELKRAPGRDASSTLDSGSDSISGNAPRKWVSGPLPLGGTYQIHGWRGNSFCVSQPVKLTEANPDAEVTLQFAPGKIFHGTVLDAAGNPLRNAEVIPSFALPDNHQFNLKSVFTDDQGRFELAEVTTEAGTYTVDVAAPGVMAETIKLKFGAQPQTIRLKRGRTLGGRVIEAGTGLAIPGAEVRAWVAPGAQPQQTTHTDADGRFEFDTLGAGAYTLFIEDGQQFSNPTYEADGSTNLVVKVKLYPWSKVKPKAPDSQSVVPMVSTPPVTVQDLRLPMVLVTAEIYQLPESDWKGLVSSLHFNPAHGDEDSWWAASPEEFSRLSGQLKDSGLKPLQRPRLQTCSGKPAQFFVGDVQGGVKLDGTELDCLPVVSGEQMNLTVHGETQGASAHAVTNQFNVNASLQNHAGMVIRWQNDASNTVVFLTAEILTGNVATANISLPNAPATNAVVFSAKTPTNSYAERQKIVAKLDHIHFPSVSFKNISLKEVVRQLNEMAEENDPGKIGINIPSATNLDDAVSQVDDAITHGIKRRGVSISIATNSVSSQSEDISSVLVDIPSLTDVRLADVLDAVVLVADHPLKYTINNSGVVFSAKNPPNSPQLFSRIFHVDTNAFYHYLKSIELRKPPTGHAEGIDLPDNISGQNIYATTPDAASMVSAQFRSFLATLGVDLMNPPGKSVFFNGRLGLLFVKATEADLDTIERALEVIVQPAPQIHLKVRFIKVSSGTLDGFEKFLNTTNPADGNAMGILSGSDEKLARQFLAARGAETLGEPEITVLSGRRMQMRVMQTITVVTNMMWVPSRKGGGAMVPQTRNAEIGPALEGAAYVLADGKTINLSVFPSLTEFLGYDGHGQTSNRTVNVVPGDKLPDISPKFQTQHLTAIENLEDGQTLVLAGLKETGSAWSNSTQMLVLGGQTGGGAKLTTVDAGSAAAKQVLIFITPTLVDSAGTRIHSAEEMLLAPSGISPQPAGQN